MSFINHQLISNAINLKKAILAVVQCQRLITSDLIIDEGALNPRQGGGGDSCHRFQQPFSCNQVKGRNIVSQSQVLSKKELFLMKRFDMQAYNNYYTIAMSKWWHFIYPQWVYLATLYK